MKEHKNFVNKQKLYGMESNNISHDDQYIFMGRVIKVWTTCMWSKLENWVETSSLCIKYNMDIYEKV